MPRYKYEITLEADRAQPAGIRKALHGTQALRMNCWGADGIKRSTGWYQVDVTGNRTKIKTTYGKPWLIGPTPRALAQALKAHDTGKPITEDVTFTIDLRDFKPAAVSNRRPRHDLDTSGSVRVRPDGTTKGPRRRAPRSDIGTRHFFDRGWEKTAA